MGRQIAPHFFIMSIYKKLNTIVSKIIGQRRALMIGFNYSPMYRRSTAWVTSISDDLHIFKIRLPLSYKNKNYVSSIFGGSMFSAVDPIPMIQLISILGEEYVVWDKSAQINFKRPAREDLYATFSFSPAQIDDIKQRVSTEKEIEIQHLTQLCNADYSKVFCEVNKTIYIADKAYYKAKRAARREGN
jgi:hypothetical protein